MLLAHYVKNGSGVDWDTFAGIDSTGVIKREQDLGVGKQDDGYDSNLVWLTTDLEQVPGACTGIGLGSLMNLHILEMIGNVAQYQQFIAERHNPVFRRYIFNSEDIGAITWMRYKNQYVRGSKRREGYVQGLDMKSRINGDNVDQYWVTEQQIPVSLAVSVSDVTWTFDDCLRYLKCSDLGEYLQRQQRSVTQSQFGKKLKKKYCV